MVHNLVAIVIGPMLGLLALSDALAAPQALTTSVVACVENAAPITAAESTTASAASSDDDDKVMPLFLQAGPW
jgi:hypothetical protein